MNYFKRASLGVKSRQQSNHKNNMFNVRSQSEILSNFSEQCEINADVANENY